MRGMSRHFRDMVFLLLGYGPEAQPKHVIFSYISALSITDNIALITGKMCVYVSLCACVKFELNIKI